MDFPLTISKTKVKAQYELVVAAAVAKAEIKGFRTGKAPRHLVEPKLDKRQLYQTVLEQLLPEFLTALITKYHLHPIATPRLKPISMTETKDWEFTVDIAEAPKIDLGDYKTHVTAALRAEKLDKDKRLAKVFDALLTNIKFDLPSLIVADETNKALSKLVDQLQKLGVTLDQYLASVKKTAAALREEYTHTATTNLKLEFILQAIAADLKIEVTDADVDALPQKSQIPADRTYIKHLLRKRKTIDTLLHLS